MNAWELPTSLTVGEEEYPIRTDFRAILDILKTYADPTYEPDEKAYICLDILFYDIDKLPKDRLQEALDRAIEFIDAGMGGGKSSGPALMDWEQDAPIIIPAVNRVLGKECRAEKYLHWYTFLGAYMEIGESLFSEVVSIRSKRAKGKTLESYEKEFYKDNANLVNLRAKYTPEEEALLNMLKKGEDDGGRVDNH